MTYHTENKARRYVKGYGFMSFAKNLGIKYGKKIINKGISASKIIKDSEQSKYGQKLKKEATKQLKDKIIPAAVDVVRSKIADKVTSGNVLHSLKVKDEEAQERKIIIPPEKRQQIINDLRMF